MTISPEQALEEDKIRFKALCDLADKYAEDEPELMVRKINLTIVAEAYKHTKELILVQKEEIDRLKARISQLESTN